LNKAQVKSQFHESYFDSCRTIGQAQINQKDQPPWGQGLHCRFCSAIQKL